ncbi:hypothetical protein AVEN_270271-1 [Araneus ventricosus]|uniref:Uncharacterized protein n=1 Tax=Araneus ventricosus TaxID=182803 RepID=A0A4Y2MK55_ARAVE|nr:hypothetical protein AVEN_270271-1 [Araneus ventricosus]
MQKNFQGLQINHENIFQHLQALHSYRLFSEDGNIYDTSGESRIWISLCSSQYGLMIIFSPLKIISAPCPKFLSTGGLRISRLIQDLGLGCAEVIKILYRHDDSQISWLM